MKERVKLLYIAEGCGVASAIIGFIGIVGYLTDQPILYSWNGHVGMAIPTATALTASGIGVLCSALSYDMRNR